MKRYIVKAEYYGNGRTEPPTYADAFIWECPEELSAAWERFATEGTPEDGVITAKWPVWKNLPEKSCHCFTTLRIKEKVCRDIVRAMAALNEKYGDGQNAGFWTDWEKVLIVGCWRADPTPVENMSYIWPFDVPFEI